MGMSFKVRNPSVPNTDSRVAIFVASNSFLLQRLFQHLLAAASLHLLRALAYVSSESVASRLTEAGPTLLLIC
jgi:hypothetical protein